MDFGNIYAVPAALSSVLYISSVFLVLRMDSRSRLNRVVVLFFLFLFLWSFTEWMLRWSDSPEPALLWAKGIMCAIIFIPPVAIHLSLVFPWSRKQTPSYIYGLYGVSTMLLALHLNTDLFVSGVSLYKAGYGTELGEYGLFIYIYLAVSVFLAILICMKHYAETDSGLALNQLRLLIIAFSVSYFLLLFTGLVPHLYGAEEIYPWTTPAFIIMGLVILYDIKKYHVFIPQAEEEASSGKTGGSAGIKLLPVQEALPTFYEEVCSGKKGLCLTARDPIEVKEELDVKKVPVVDIKKVCKNTTCLRTPEGRSLIPFLVTDTIMEKNTALLLDGMENIFPKSEFEEFIDDMKELEMRNSTLIVSVSRGDYINDL